MLGLSDEPASKVYTANVLPCRIHHSGSASSDPRYWSPHEDDTGNGNIAYFRGRRLLGRDLSMRHGFQGRFCPQSIPSSFPTDPILGVVLRKTDQVKRDDTVKSQATEELEAQRHSMDPAAYDMEVEALRAASRRGELDGDQVILMETTASLNSFKVWGHESTPPKANDAYAKGVEEWMAFATAVS